jgi:DNA-binding transcriptional regulator LsrR (DeoR family)
MPGRKQVTGRFSTRQALISHIRWLYLVSDESTRSIAAACKVSASTVRNIIKENIL